MFLMAARPLSRVLILVEGPTERAVVSKAFSPALGLRGVRLYPRVVGKPGQKGGNKFARVRKELRALMLQEPESFVTMLFDYYGLPDDWPGVVSARGKNRKMCPALLNLRFPMH